MKYCSNVNPTYVKARPPTQIIMAKLLIKASFLICVHGCLSLKVELKRSVLDVGRIRFLGVGGFQMGDFGGKFVGLQKQIK